MRSIIEELLVVALRLFLFDDLGLIKISEELLVGALGSVDGLGSVVDG